MTHLQKIGRRDDPFVSDPLMPFRDADIGTKHGQRFVHIYWLDVSLPIGDQAFDGFWIARNNTAGMRDVGHDRYQIGTVLRK